MKKIILTALLLCSSAHASFNDPVATEPAGEGGWQTLSTSVTLSYDSRYMLYGYDLGQDLYHASLDFWMPISETVSVWAGSWYGTQPGGLYKEIDFYTGIDIQLSDHFSAGLAYSMFNYIEVQFPTSKQAHEISGHLSYTAGPLTLSLRDLYDSEGNGHLTRGIATIDHSLTDTFGLSLHAEYGYSFDYFNVGDGPNHALFKLSCPWQINDTLSLSPFIAHSMALDVLDAFETDHTYGGLSLSASF